MRRKVSGGNNKVPENGGTSYKQKLFGFLSQISVAFDCPKGFFLLLMLMFLPKGPVMVVPCNQEEADTRLLGHLVDALKNGRIYLHGAHVDTDVIVIIIRNLDLISIKKSKLKKLLLFFVCALQFWSISLCNYITTFLIYLCTI